MGVFIRPSPRGWGFSLHIFQMEYIEHCAYAKNAYEMRLVTSNDSSPLELDELFAVPVCCDMDTTHTAYKNLIHWIKSGASPNHTLLQDANMCMWMLCVADFVCAKKSHLDILSKVFAQVHLPFHINYDRK